MSKPIGFKLFWKCSGPLLILLGLVTVAFTTTSADSVSKVKPNVLIILTDDLGYGDISSYGQKKYSTPHIDAIAAEGVSSTSFYVPTPYCAPSRATLLTGRFPLRHGLIKNPTPDAAIVLVDTIGLSPNEVTLAEVFRESGYTTKMIGKWHLGHKEKFFPVNQGFDEYYGILYSNDMRPVQIVENKDTVQTKVDQRYLTKDYTQRAIDFIKKQKDDPFFLYLAHAMPHKPLAASDRFYTPETPNDLYADVVRELDWGIGEVMQTLKKEKILDNTIVIFMSDNGPWYGGSSGPFKGMKATTWEGGIRVPFMIRYPKVFPKNKKIDLPLWSPDIFPTLMALTDCSPLQKRKLDGEDITEILQGKSKEHNPVFSMHNNEIMSVRKGNMKLFVNRPKGFIQKDYSNWVDPRAPDGTTIFAQYEQATPNDYPGVIPQKPKNKIQLFDLSKDVEEANDLANAKPELVAELMKAYQSFQNGFSNK